MDKKLFKAFKKKLDAEFEANNFNFEGKIGF